MIESDFASLVCLRSRLSPPQWGALSDLAVSSLKLEELFDQFKFRAGLCLDSGSINFSYLRFSVAYRQSEVLLYFNIIKFCRVLRYMFS